MILIMEIIILEISRIYAKNHSQHAEPNPLIVHSISVHDQRILISKEKPCTQSRVEG